MTTAFDLRLPWRAAMIGPFENRCVVLDRDGKVVCDIRGPADLRWRRACAIVDALNVDAMSDDARSRVP